ncbi:hypothetical protein ACWEQP_32735 [Streptomyces sp. NPDC004044]
MNVQPLFEALDVQEDAALAMADGLRTQVNELQTRLREVETHLEHLAITRKTVTALADRIPTRADSPGLPEHPDSPASSPSSTRPPAPSGPATFAKPSTTSCCRRTSKAPAPR